MQDSTPRYVTLSRLSSSYQSLNSVSGAVRLHRLRRVGKVNYCKTNEDHPSKWIHARRVNNLQTHRLPKPARKRTGHRTRDAQTRRRPHPTRQQGSRRPHSRFKNRAFLCHVWRGRRASHRCTMDGPDYSKDYGSFERVLSNGQCVVFL